MKDIIHEKRRREFFSKVNKQSVRMYNGTPCWEWTGFTCGGLYPRPYASFGGMYAHRYVWIKVLGRDPEIGKHLHHNCKNSLCVNPDHLEMLTRVEHMMRHREHWGRVRKPRSRKYLTRDELRRLLAVVKKGDKARNAKRDYCLIFMMCSHHLGVSEVCRLKISYIDLETGTIFIGRIKNGAPVVHSIVNGVEIKLLQEWLKVREAILPSKPCYNDFLFLTQQRTPIQPMTVWVMFQKYGKAAGLDNLAIHPQMLRHAHRCDLADEWNTTDVIRGLGGHHSIQYVSPYPEGDPSHFADLKSKYW